MKLNLDPTRHLHGELTAAFERVLSSDAYILGPEYRAFCDEFAAFHGDRYHTVGTGSGLDALEFLLRAHGIGPGDEVITPAFNVAYTALSVVRAGATPVFADVDASTYCLDPAATAAAITPRTAAIVPVHLFGQMSPMTDLRTLATTRSLLLLEDAAQALGATQHGALAGTLSDGAIFSFYPTKVLGALGDGGAILVRDAAIAARCARLADGGREDRYAHTEISTNSRLDDLQAALLRARLPHLPDLIARRNLVARTYNNALPNPPALGRSNTHVYYLYVIESPERDALLAHLTAHRIPALAHYPIPAHLQPCFAHLGGRRGQHPTAERAASRVLSLPCHPAITPADQLEVLHALNSFA